MHDAARQPGPGELVTLPPNWVIRSLKPTLLQWLEQADDLVWLPVLGIGYYPVDPQVEPYRGGPAAEVYFRKYQRYRDTEMGQTLNTFRLEFVRRHWDGPLLDVGIGCGSFIEAHGDARGYDVNPLGVAWLEKRDLWTDVYSGPLQDALTLWDVLEHLEDPAVLLERVAMDGWVFCSLPVFTSGEHIQRSRHFRPTEHRWYFSRKGLREYMGRLGFEQRDWSRGESDLGREDIETFAFRRTRPCS